MHFKQLCCCRCHRTAPSPPHTRAKKYECISAICVCGRPCIFYVFEICTALCARILVLTLHIFRNMHSTPGLQHKMLCNACACASIDDDAIISPIWCGGGRKVLRMQVLFFLLVLQIGKCFMLCIRFCNALILFVCLFKIQNILREPKRKSSAWLIGCCSNAVLWHTCVVIVTFRWGRGGGLWVHIAIVTS